MILSIQYSHDPFYLISFPRAHAHHYISLTKQCMQIFLSHGWHWEWKVNPTHDIHIKGKFMYLILKMLWITILKNISKSSAMHIHTKTLIMDNNTWYFNPYAIKHMTFDRSTISNFEPLCKRSTFNKFKLLAVPCCISAICVLRDEENEMMCI